MLILLKWLLQTVSNIKLIIKWSTIPSKSWDWLVSWYQRAWQVFAEHDSEHVQCRCKWRKRDQSHNQMLTCKVLWTPMITISNQIYNSVSQWHWWTVLKARNDRKTQLGWTCHVCCFSPAVCSPRMSGINCIYFSAFIVWIHPLLLLEIPTWVHQQWQY